MISSTATRQELPAILRFLGRIKIINIVPSFFFTAPPFLIFWIFGINTEEGKRLITEIIEGTDKSFTKRSVKKILEWTNKEIAPNTIRIHGTKDLLLPAPKSALFIEVKNAGHFMIGNRKGEISKILNKEMAQLGVQTPL